MNVFISRQRPCMKEKEGIEVEALGGLGRLVLVVNSKEKAAFLGALVATVISFPHIVSDKLHLADGIS